MVQPRKLSLESSPVSSVTLLEPVSDEDDEGLAIQSAVPGIKLGDHWISRARLPLPQTHEAACQTDCAEDLNSSVISEGSGPAEGGNKSGSPDSVVSASQSDTIAKTCGTDTSEEAQKAKAKEREAQIQALAVPGYKVEQDGVFTIIRRTDFSGRSGTFPARLARWLRSSKQWLPYLKRFVRECFAISPRRMAIFFISRSICSLAPAARLWATSRILTIVETAIETGQVRPGQLAGLVALGGLLSTGLSGIQVFLARNAGILERHFEGMISSRLLKAMSGLDMQQYNAPETRRLFSDAASTMNAASDQAFKIVADVVKIFTSAMGVASQAVLLKSTINRHNVDLIAISFAANIIKSAEWLFRGDPGVSSGVTNPIYQRMQAIYSESSSVSSEDIILGLPKYWSSEYDKANEKLGDLWTYRLKDKSRLAATTGFFADIYEPFVYALFAMRAASRRTANSLASGAFQTTFSMGALSYIQSATSTLATELASFAYTVDDVRQHCTDVLQFYRAFEVKPLMIQPAQARPYISQVATGPARGSVIRGMEVELKNIHFKYPDSDRLALSGVSFKVKPGSLTCIVGYNGAGKSTLIDLICRVCDPTAGQVLINGYDAKEYASTDLYKKIACQYQQSFKSDVTIREFLHMGDTSGRIADSAKMQECLEAAGVATVVVNRFPKGLEARLGPYPADPTPQSCLKDTIDSDEHGVIDPWDAAYLKRSQREIESDEELEDEVVGGAGAGGVGSLKGKDCAFSPGEWQKLCFARMLMKQNADLRIFDEPSSALDPLAAKMVFDKIESLRGGCTVIHITHDLAACIKADQVIMFEDGKLIETGTHADLLEKADSRYRAFYMAHTGQDEDGQSADDDAPGEDAHEDEGQGETGRDASSSDTHVDQDVQLKEQDST